MSLFTIWLFVLTYFEAYFVEQFTIGIECLSRVFNDRLWQNTMASREARCSGKPPGEQDYGHQSLIMHVSVTLLLLCLIFCSIVFLLFIRGYSRKY